MGLGGLKLSEDYGAVLAGLYEEGVARLDVEGFSDFPRYPNVEGCVPASSPDLPDDDGVLDGRCLHLLCSCVVGKLISVIRVVRYFSLIVRIVR